MEGRLIPLQGGKPVLLDKEKITIGRKPHNDVVLAYSNVSSIHCTIEFDRGCWVVVDQNSTNGVQVNEVRVVRKRLRPGDQVTIARKHHFRIDYTMSGTFVDDDILHERTIQKQKADEMDFEDLENMFSQSLLSRAGLGGAKRDDDEEPEGDAKTDSAAKVPADEDEDWSDLTLDVFNWDEEDEEENQRRSEEF